MGWEWKKTQISPLRYAPVEMTILLVKPICHLDRSAPGFLLRVARYDRVCGFLQGKPHKFANATNLDRNPG
jgi:hypothetical protein